MAVAAGGGAGSRRCRKRTNPRVRPFLLGVAAGVIGLIAAATVDIVDTSLVDVYTGVLAIAAFATLQRWHGSSRGSGWF